MKVSKVLELHAILKEIGSAETPMRMTIARNLTKTEPIAAKFIEDKDEKFNSLVAIDSKQEPVILDEIKEIIKEGKIDPKQGLPFGAYEFDSPTGLKELVAYLEVCKDEEVEFNPSTISQSKLIRLQKDDKEIELVALSDLLEATDSKITANALRILIEAGILID